MCADWEINSNKYLGGGGIAGTKGRWTGILVLDKKQVDEQRTGSQSWKELRFLLTCQHATGGCSITQEGKEAKCIATEKPTRLGDSLAQKLKKFQAEESKGEFDWSLYEITETKNEIITLYDGVRYQNEGNKREIDAWKQANIIFTDEKTTGQYEAQQSPFSRLSSAGGGQFIRGESPKSRPIAKRKSDHKLRCPSYLAYCKKEKWKKWIRFKTGWPYPSEKLEVGTTIIKLGRSGYVEFEVIKNQILDPEDVKAYKTECTASDAPGTCRQYIFAIPKGYWEVVEQKAGQEEKLENGEQREMDILNNMRKIDDIRTLQREEIDELINNVCYSGESGSVYFIDVGENVFEPVGIYCGRARLNVALATYYGVFDENKRDTYPLTLRIEPLDRVIEKIMKRVEVKNYLSSKKVQEEEAKGLSLRFATASDFPQAEEEEKKGQ